MISVFYGNYKNSVLVLTCSKKRCILYVKDFTRRFGGEDSSACNKKIVCDLSAFKRDAG